MATFFNKEIKNTYQRILQLDNGVVQDGLGNTVTTASYSGSFTGSFSGTLTGTASFAISASHEIIKEISSSHANFADTASGLFGTPSIAVTNITASGDISGSNSSNLIVGGNVTAGQGHFSGFISASNDLLVEGANFKMSNDSAVIKFKDKKVAERDPLLGNTAFGDTSLLTIIQGNSISMTAAATGSIISASSLIGNGSGIVGVVTSSFAQTASFVAQAVTNASNITTNTTNISNLTSLTGSYPTTGSNNFIGTQAISGSLTITGSFIPHGTGPTTNVVIGEGAAPVLGSGGGENIVIGKDAGAVLNGGDYNILIGTDTGKALTSAYQNVIIGRRAGQVLHNSNAIYNVIIGADAGQGAGGAGHAKNVIVGFQAGYETDGEQNVYIGNATAKGTGGADADKGVAIGSTALYSIRDGNHNNAIGMSSLYSTRDGSDNIGLGYFAGYNIQDGNGNIIIGSGSLGTAAMSNQLRIGNSDTIVISASLTTGDITFTSTASATYFSGDGSQLTNLQRPIITHTSTFSISSSQFIGVYNIVGGDFTCSIQTGSLPPGVEFEFFQTSSAGNFNFATASNIDLIVKDDNVQLAGRGSGATLKYISGDIFHLVGDLS
jgi:hypothetical protein